MKLRVNAEAIVILHCGLLREELNKIKDYRDARDLWSKLIEQILTYKEKMKNVNIKSWRMYQRMQMKMIHPLILFRG